MKTVKPFLLVLISYILCACIAPVDEPTPQEQTTVTLSATAIVPIIDPNSLVTSDPASKVYEVTSGTPTNKNDHDASFQVVENQIFTLNDRKVSRFGPDSMEGPLDIFPVGTDETPINTEGTGNGLGGMFKGGPTGRGARSEAGGGNNNGHEGLGAGTGAGLYGIGGATGPGVKAIGNAGDNTAIALLSQGGARLDDTPPAATTDPGADNTIWSQSINSSSALVASDGAGNFTVNGNGFNVATFAGTALGVGTITFARALPGNNYRIMVFATDPYTARWNGVQNVGNFQFLVKDAAGVPVDLTTVATTFFVTTVGY